MPPRGDLLGSLEQIVLLALVQLGDDAYGMTVRREIEARTGRNVSIGAIYATLERLEGKGLVSSFTGDPTPERGGRAKRYYALRPRAVDALKESRRALVALWSGLEAVLAQP